MLVVPIDWKNIMSVTNKKTFCIFGASFFTLVNRRCPLLLQDSRSLFIKPISHQTQDYTTVIAAFEYFQAYKTVGKVTCDKQCSSFYFYKNHESNFLSVVWMNFCEMIIFVWYILICVYLNNFKWALQPTITWSFFHYIFPHL